MTQDEIFDLHRLAGHNEGRAVALQAQVDYLMRMRHEQWLHIQDLKAEIRSWKRLAKQTVKRTSSRR
jgi:hypothetical protein